MTKRVRSGLVSPPASAVAGVRCSDTAGHEVGKNITDTLGPEISGGARVLTGGIYERLSGAAGQPLGRGYQRREPERTVLHELVSRHAQTMLAELRAATAAACLATSSASSPSTCVAASPPTASPGSAAKLATTRS